MPEISKLRHDRFKLVTAFLVVGIISLVQPGCDCSSSNGGTASPSVVESVSPLSSSATALVATDVTALFSDEMDGVTVESSFSLTVNSMPVSATVSYDALTKTATLSPDIDLVSGTEYRATIASSVEDINGEMPLSTDYVWSFTTSPAMLLTSKNASGVTGDNISSASDIDATGRYIVFESKATNLTSIATTPGRIHVYRKDTITGEVTLVSSDSGQVEADNDASNPSISTNGRYAVFESKATNLDLNANTNSQIYLKDLESNSITMVSRNDEGFPDNGTGARDAKVSDDGRYILLLSSDINMSISTINSGGITQVYMKDLSNSSVKMISQTAANIAGNTSSNNPDMSADGTHVVFESLATNLTGSTSLNHIYYVDTSVVQAVEQVSVATDGAQANAASNKPSISNDGSTIVFQSNATNLNNLDNDGMADIYLHYRPSGRTELVTVNPNNNAESGDDASSNAHVSGNAEYVVFESLALNLASGGTPGVASIFVRDLAAWPGTIIEKLDNPSSSRPSSKPAISTDGRYISFHSSEKYSDDTDTLSDVFRVHNSTHP